MEGCETLMASAALAVLPWCRGHEVFELAQIYLNQFFESSEWEMNIFH
jgi:hypothetical protein